MNVLFSPIRVEPAYRKVAAALLQRITDRTLAAGERLPPETELARQFGVNRSTVREALRELESGGLLVRRRGSKRLMVTHPDDNVIAGGVSRALTLHEVSVLDVWEALTMLEPSIAEMAARRRTAADLQRVTLAAEGFVRKGGDTVAAVQCAAEFFRRVGGATHNRVLLLAQEPLLQLLEPSLQAMIDKVPQARTRIAGAHRQLIDAIRSRDVEEARSWMAKHIRDFRRGYDYCGIDMAGPV
ncbi:MAG: FadR family transcriptional regulator [Gammaproteobacteria bacterium]|nr:FadR family transcriptional regulator [Gammaproteobacteria bacterium]